MEITPDHFEEILKDRQKIDSIIQTLDNFFTKQEKLNDELHKSIAYITAIILGDNSIHEDARWKALLCREFLKQMYYGRSRGGGIKKSTLIKNICRKYESKHPEECMVLREILYEDERE